MSDPGIKNFLYQWLNKNRKVAPEYCFTEKHVGRGRIRFVCEVNAPGFNYVGIGNSTNKKDAQTNAARDFSNFLSREGHIKPDELPTIFNDIVSAPNEQPNAMPSYGSSNSTNPPIAQPPMRQQTGFSGSDSYINRIYDQKKLEEAEEIDLTADIHGGWTLELAKARLNEYMQENKQTAKTTKYTPIGPEHNRSFLAEQGVYAKKARKEIFARESASTKALASRACALSLIRQLYHLGEIAAYTGERKRKKHDEVPPYNVYVDPHVENQLDHLLETLAITPSPVPTVKNALENGYSMITNYKVADFEPSSRVSAQMIPWAPPQTNWNPWTATNIDEGPEATMSLDQVSVNLQTSFMQGKSAPSYATIQHERSQLPVHAYYSQIVNTIQNNQITLIRGETGCGKTTQVPQYILDSYLEAGQGAYCSVLVTQPRRISAISLAERVANERGESVGSSVGYTVRFETILPRPYGSVCFCTVGTMSRKMEGGMRGITHVVVDEIHERDVSTDFMLILLRDMLSVHRDLRVVLMSATIDVSLFTDFFGGIAMLDLEGRTYPVTSYFLEDCVKMLNYTPPPLDDRKKKRRDDASAVHNDPRENCNLTVSPEYGPRVAQVMRDMTEKEIPFDLYTKLLDHICGMGVPGAVLIFLPGWNMISMLRKHLQMHPRYGGPGFLILPLHSMVPREEQRLIFRCPPDGVRKIVLSTNIAESSITINDVVFVIDSCLHRVKIFNSRNNLTSYATEWASVTNLEQRKGRAGRVREGYCFRICSKERFNRLDQHVMPEMLRTPLHELALLIKLLRLGSVNEFLKKAMQPPPLDAIIEAEFLLRDMKALDANDELTPLGKILARLPVEPRLGKMLIFACAFGLGGVASVLVASTSVGGEMFSIPPDKRRLSFGQIRLAANKSSDHLAGINAFQMWTREREMRGEQAADMFCDQKELNSQALKVVEDAGNQVRTIMLNAGFPESSMSDAPIHFRHDMENEKVDLICGLLTGGLYPNIAYHVDKRKLLTSEGAVALIHKSSVNCASNDPKFFYPFFAFGEKLRTQAVSCKTMTMVSPIMLMLFGCRQAIFKIDDKDAAASTSSDPIGHVRLDDWIPLRMRFSSAARIFALRPALEALMVRVCLRPDCLDEADEHDVKLMEIIKILCAKHAFVTDPTKIDDSSNAHAHKRPYYGHSDSPGESPLLSGNKFRRHAQGEEMGMYKARGGGWSSTFRATGQSRFNEVRDNGYSRGRGGSGYAGGYSGNYGGNYGGSGGGYFSGNGGGGYRGGYGEFRGGRGFGGPQGFNYGRGPSNANNGSGFDGPPQDMGNNINWESY